MCRTQIMVINICQGMMRMVSKLIINTWTMRSFHLFGDIYEQAVLSATSGIAAFAPDRSSRDCNGKHWYGMRVHMDCLRTGQRFYLHTGLIFLPERRTGLMVELDRNNNHEYYETIWNRIKGGALFEVNRDEPAYLKLFMPDSDFILMNLSDRGEQQRILRVFFTACSESICNAAMPDSFRLDYSDLANSLELTCAYHDALNQVTSNEYTIEVNPGDPDNFGQYAAGFRYWLIDARGLNRMYAYFGGIFSYKKNPAGVFVEIDWQNNQDVFEKTFADIHSNDIFIFSQVEPKFIKLFMSPTLVEHFNESAGTKQKEILREFLDACNMALIFAARKRNVKRSEVKE